MQCVTLDCENQATVRITTTHGIIQPICVPCGFEIGQRMKPLKTLSTHRLAQEES